jgi:uncharacterized protein with PIN domain
VKFILTPELGRLAKWLRILGFDAAYSAEVNFSSLLIHALRDNRIILTRNSHFIHKAQMTKAVWIKSEGVNQQLKQVIKELGLRLQKELMFSRCTICNMELKNINKQQVKNKLPEYVFKTQQKFFICPSCQRIYWPGTHWGNVTEALEEVEHGIPR